MKIETLKGLWVSDGFTKKFGNEDITPAKTVPSFKVLPRDMYDHEIKSELGPDECTLADMAAFLQNPPEGTDDGNWNIFYVAGCVVNVGWGSDDREWRVGSWELGVGLWDAGYRAFGCNWNSATLNSELSPSDSLTLEKRVANIEKILEHHNLGV